MGLIGGRLGTYYGIQTGHGPRTRAIHVPSFPALLAGLKMLNLISLLEHFHCGGFCMEDGLLLLC